MNSLNQQKGEIGGVLWIIPCGIGVLFVGLMLYFAVISTPKAREHYQAKRLQEAVYKVSQIRITNPALNVFNNKTTPTPEPTPSSTPQKSIIEQMNSYEPFYPFVALFVLILGFKMGGLAIGIMRLKNRNSTAKSSLFLRSIWAMFALFCFSFSILIFYIWTLRIGLIE